MRFQADDAANHEGTRRRRQPGTGGGPAQPPPAESVFMPGYDTGRAAREGNPTAQAGPGRSGPAWYGSAAGGAAGKGPVRGYPPVPGQPPPMYPPGQFAAWNRGQLDRSRAGPPYPGQPGPGQSEAARPGSGQPGQGQRHASSPGSIQPASGQSAATQPASGQPGGQASWQAPVSGTLAASTSGYYGRDDGPETEPGYSMLAVSDPAADVTSTQTWRAVGDGRATGTWMAPARPGTGPDTLRPRQAAPGAGSTRSDPWVRTGHARPQPGLDPGPGPVQAAPADAVTRQAETAQDPPVKAADRVSASPARRSGRSRGGAHTGPHTVQRPRRQRPASVKLAMAGALLLVVAAASALAYVVLRNPAKPRQPAATAAKSTPASTPSPSPSLGLYGHIGSRKTDPQPLTVAQLFPASFKVSGVTVVRTDSSHGGNCASAVIGSSLQSAVGAAGCDQVVRATYLSTSQKMMGTIGVLNLSSGNAAKTAARSAGATDFIEQLAAHQGPSSKIGKGTGIEEAAAKGHYLILIWAEFTSLRKPTTAQQRAELEQFMTQLLEKTANVSLTNRMLNGTP